MPVVRKDEPARLRSPYLVQLDTAAWERCPPDLRSSSDYAAVLVLLGWVGMWRSSRWNVVRLWAGTAGDVLYVFYCCESLGMVLVEVMQLKGCEYCTCRSGAVRRMEKICLVPLREMISGTRGVIFTK
jgi:hypothetical protein